MSRLGKLIRATAAAALTAVGVAPAAAQQPAAPAPLPDISDFLSQNQVTPAGWGRSSALSGCQPAPCNPCYPCSPCPPTAGYPGAPYTPYTGMPPTGQPVIPPGAMGAPGGAPVSFAGLEGGAGTPSTIGGAYIENAVPVTMFRLRYDSAYRDNRPDRAEFFYAKCGCFHTPDAHGPPLAETSVDYQELSSYLEVAITPRFSVYGNIPVRWINPEVNSNAAGIADVDFGMKYAFIYSQRRVVSFGLRTIAPSGRSASGLGTANWWLEPGLFYLGQPTCRWQVFGEVRDQIPVDRRSDFTGNVLRYGLGTNYMVASGRWGYIAPTIEFVGWSVLSGKEAADGGVAVSASGDTIVNGKFGVRIGFGQANPGQPYPTRSDLY